MDTIQDTGRYGFQHLGINPSGAMDKYAMQQANALVGNRLDEAVIELHFPASIFLFSKPALIALSGADFSASINGEPVSNLRCIVVNKNDALQFHRPVSGTRTYLAVYGGLDIKSWLHSKSTNSKARVGGFEGRKLLKGDEIPLSTKKDFSYLLNEKKFKIFPWTAESNSINKPYEIAILQGNEWEQLTDESKKIFSDTAFVITRLADRMGYRLGNNPLISTVNDELISSAVTFGTIQLLPDGKLIVLMADHQTMGGYPRLAHVITAHHTKLAQLRTGDGISFKFTNLETAEDLLYKQQQYLQQLQNACILRLQQYLHEN